MPGAVPGTWQMLDSCLLNERIHEWLTVEHKEMRLMVAKADCNVGVMEVAKSSYRYNAETPGLGEGYRLKNYEDLNQGREWRHIKRVTVLKNEVRETM